MTPEQQRAIAIASARARISGLKQEGAPRNPGMHVPSGEKDLSPTSPANLAGHPLTRFATGAAKPLMGAVQFGANLLGDGEMINEHMRGYNQLEQQGRKNMGSDGFDWWSAGGQALSPAYLGAAKALPNAATTTGRIGQGAAVGAAAGAAEPVYDPSQYGATKAGQIGMGAGMGAAIPGAFEGAKAVGRGVRNATQPYMGEWGANRSAGRLANQVAGDKADDVARMLDVPGEIVPGSMPTAGQAASPVGSAEFSALQRIAETRDPSKYVAITKAQEGARSGAVSSVAGNEATVRAAEGAREAASKPLREAAFDATRQVGVSTEKLIRQIRGVESQPGIRASDVVSKSLAEIKEKIAKFADEDGFINAKDLYTIRKEVGNTIKRNSQETANWDKRLTGGLERDLQKNIDDAIEAAGGSTWKDYLSTYSEKSKPIQQMRMAQELEKKLDPALGTKQRASGYAEALRKSGTEGDLDVMTQPQMSKLLGVGADLSREANMQGLAKAGRPAALEKIGSAVPEAAPTGFFDPKISFARGLYNRISGQATNRILDQLGKNMDNPQMMAKLMREAKPFERQAIMDELMRYQATTPQVIDQGR